MEGFQKKNVTPYMHCMVFHVPEMLKKYKNLRQFSGQGMNVIVASYICCDVN